MKKFLRRVLGVESLSAQVGVLNQRVRELKNENERLELEMSMCKAKALDLNTTQAGKLHAIVKEARRVCSFGVNGFIPADIVSDFNARNFGGNICQ